MYMNTEFNVTQFIGQLNTELSRTAITKNIIEYVVPSRLDNINITCDESNNSQESITQGILNITVSERDNLYRLFSIICRAVLNLSSIFSNFSPISVPSVCP
jgi:hypothetical protein